MSKLKKDRTLKRMGKAMTRALTTKVQTINNYIQIEQGETGFPNCKIQPLWHNVCFRKWHQSLIPVQ